MRGFHHHHHRGEEAHRHHFGRRGFGGPGHHWRGEAGEGRGGRGRRRVFDSGELRLVLLKLTGWQPIDSIMAFAVAGYILFISFSQVKKAVSSPGE